jgi:NAD-dependent dihydropyrimidine dehydrogenase PreA subunit
MHIILIFLFLLLSLSSVSGQLSPGDLSRPHEHLEGLKNCTKCHEIGKKVLPDKCLTCHVLLNDRIKSGEGLHARDEYQNCVECHSDHQGTNYDLIWWKEGRDNFDHAKTGYTLQGKHLAVDCNKCHNAKNIADIQKYTSQKKNPDKTFLGLDTQCISCHLDEHRGQLDTQCAKCHDFNAWKPVQQFDHNKTKFSLSGRHLTVDCVLCHKKIEDTSNNRDQDYLKFSGLKFANCSDCHGDPHAGRLGGACKNCHTLSGWKGVVNKDFNHDLTRFPLSGKHNNVRCDRCHRPNQSLKNLVFSRCRNCHQDYHQGQFSHRQQRGACEECHTEKGFIPANFTVEQHNVTGYPLEGAHLAVPCNFCHPKNANNRPQFRFSSTDCLNCHRDPHNRESERYVAQKSTPAGKDGCQYCHSVTSWGSIEFDHSQTNFKLDGKHQNVSCKSCHETKDSNMVESVNLKLDKKECRDCHQDVHMGQFDTQSEVKSDGENLIQCDNCHTTSNWIASNFEHNRDSHFKLEGVHKQLNCSKCHKIVNVSGQSFVRFKPIEYACSSCHEKRTMAQ